MEIAFACGLVAAIVMWIGRRTKEEISEALGLRRAAAQERRESRRPAPRTVPSQVGRTVGSLASGLLHGLWYGLRNGRAGWSAGWWEGRERLIDWWERRLAPEDEEDDYEDEDEDVQPAAAPRPRPVPPAQWDPLRGADQGPLPGANTEAPADPVSSPTPASPAAPALQQTRQVVVDMPPSPQGADMSNTVHT